MNLFQDYALLFAVAIPVIALVGLNVFLWFGGERRTLVLPSSGPCSAQAATGIAGAPVRAAEVKVDTVAPVPANDVCAREAA